MYLLFITKFLITKLFIAKLLNLESPMWQASGHVYGGVSRGLIEAERHTIKWAAQFCASGAHAERKG